KIERPTSTAAVGGLSAPAPGASNPTIVAAAPARRHRVMSPCRKRSALVDQRMDRVERPENAGRRPMQRRAERGVDMIGGQVERHVMPEMRQHPGHVKAGRPFPGVFLLRCSRSGKNPATQIGKSRRTDHDRTPRASNGATIATSRTLVIAGNPYERR